MIFCLMHILTNIFQKCNKILSCRLPKLMVNACKKCEMNFLNLKFKYITEFFNNLKFNSMVFPLQLVFSNLWLCQLSYVDILDF